MLIENSFVKYLLFIICVCLISIQLSVINVYAESDENFFEVNYNNFNGLPTSESNDILQTEDGHIWIASYSSLIRYDGKEFTTFSDQGLTSILCLFVDSKERLWIGTNNDGVVLYEDNTFKFISIGKDISSFSARCITETSDGKIIVGTALGMYIIDENLNFSNFEDTRLENSFVIKLESFGDNGTVGLTKTGEIFFIEGTQVVDFISVDQWAYDLPLCVLPLQDDIGDYFLVGTNDSYLVKMRKNSNGRFSYQTISTDTLRTVNALMLDSKGRIWIGCDYGIGYLNTDSNIVDLDALSMSKSIENMLEDFEGNYWLVSSKEGVAKLNPTIFKNVSKNVEVPTQMNGVEILDGYIYIASSNGIDIINQKDLSIVENEFTQKYRGGYFRCVQQDSLGNLWFSSYTDDGLIKYTPKTGEVKTFSYDQGLDYSRIRSTMTASDGAIWVATGDGIYIVKDDQVTNYYGSDLGMLNLEILTISEDAKGRVFAGTDGAGVYIFEKTASGEYEITKRLSRGEGLLSDIILRTETDPINDGTWIITGNSIAFYDFDNDELRNITKFPYGNNYDLLFFEDNMIILCSNGIFFVSHEDMLSTSDEPLPYLHKNHSNGLYSAAVANSFSKIDDGLLYLCGYQNITTFDLKVSSEDSSYIPPVSMPLIQANETEVFPLSDGSFHLSSNANFLLFDILIPTYALTDYDVSYELIGYDSISHLSSYSSHIDPTYTNLPGGEYVFLVNLIDNRSGVVINSAEFNIVKDYSLTEHPIFRAVLIMVIVFVVFMIGHSIVKQREKKAKRQKDAVTTLFHDTLEVLSKVIDAKDRYTNGHSRRVGYYTKVISTALGFSEEEIESAYGIALLHDIGKIGIPDEVLNKPGRLNKDEFEIMKGHASGGGDILERIHAWPDLVVGAKYHHERYDGTGYSDGLKGEEIPLIARIICVADAFDAMYSSRVYRKKMELDVILGELENNSGTQFDPEICGVFVNLIRSGEINEALQKFAKEDEEV